MVSLTLNIKLTSIIDSVGMMMFTICLRNFRNYKNLLLFKSFVFGGMLGRDDAYDSLHEHGINNELPWATGIPLDDLPSPRPKVVRLTENKPNFSFPAEYGDCD